jgi:uncharacterized protein
MIKPITYNLRYDSENSDDYFDEIANYADFVHEFIERNYAWIISQYQSFVLNKIYEKERSRGEYCLELLMLGMVWHKYSGASQNTSKLILSIVDFLNSKGVYGFKLKNKIEKLNGFLIGAFVAPHINEAHKSYNYTQENFLKLLFWMDATGKFKEEISRLKNWSALFSSLNEWKIDFIISSAIAIFDWFTISSHLTLGKYTENLAEFLKEHPKGYKYREDGIFTGKDETEYHFNMVGSEIINNGFKTEFEKLTDKVLLIPDCMRAELEMCSANNLECDKCNASCRVNRLRKLESENFFDVKVIPHSNYYVKYFEQLKMNRDTGLIVATCLPNIVTSSFVLRQSDIQTQFIALDYCGCKKHWHWDGIATDLNENQILKIIDQSWN